jgi:hypothetical protein
MRVPLRRVRSKWWYAIGLVIVTVAICWIRSGQQQVLWVEISPIICSSRVSCVETVNACTTTTDDTCTWTVRIGHSCGCSTRAAHCPPCSHCRWPQSGVIYAIHGTRVHARVHPRCSVRVQLVHDIDDWLTHVHPAYEHLTPVHKSDYFRAHILSALRAFFVIIPFSTRHVWWHVH